MTTQNTSERLQAWRSLPKRRTLVTALFTSLGLYSAGGILDNPYLILASLISYIALLILVRNITRELADSPASRLDERQEYIRNLLYLQAYRLCGGVVSLFVTGAFLWDLRANTVPMHVVTSLLLALLLFMLAAPSCIFAWTEKEI